MFRKMWKVVNANKRREEGKEDKVDRLKTLTAVPFVAAIEAVEDIVTFTPQENTTTIVATKFPARIAFPSAFWPPAWIGWV